MKTTFSSRQLLLAVQARTLVAALRDTELSAAMKLAVLDVVVALGEWVKVLRPTETLTAADQVALLSHKALADLGASADAAILAIGLGKQDTSLAVDTALLFSALKVLSDLGAGVDTVSLALHHPVDDLGNAGDTASLHPHKSLVDSAALFDLSQVLSISKELLDQSSSHEAVLHALEKSLGDSTDSVEQVILDIARVLDDSANASDTFNSAGHSDDDETITFTKVTSDLAALEDEVLLTTSFLRGFEEFTAAVEVWNFVLDLAMQDATTSDELLVFNTDKPLFEEALTPDLAQIHWASAYYDLAQSGDTALLHSHKAVSDLSQSSELGSMFILDYAPNTYFAEDYVGETRTF